MNPNFTKDNAGKPAWKKISESLETRGKQIKTQGDCQYMPPRMAKMKIMMN